MMKVRPLADRVLIQRVEEEEKVGSIVIPDTAKEKPLQAKVIAAGEGRKTDEGKVIPLEVKAGNTVLVGKYAGTEVKVEGEDYVIVREDDLLGIVK